MIQNYKIIQVVFFILPFLLFTTHVNSQDTIKAMDYFNNAEFTKASQEFEKLIVFYKNKYGEKDTTYYAKALFCAGLCYSYTGKRKQALEYYFKTKDVYRKTNNFKRFSYGNILDVIVEMYLSFGDEIKAEPYLVEQTEIYRQILGDKHNITYESILKLAELYDKLKMYQKAEIYYLQYINIIKSLSKDKTTPYAFILHKTAKVCNKNLNFEKAIQFENEAKTIIRKTLGAEHELYIDILIHLGELYYHTYDYENAEKTYLNAKEISLKTQGKNSDKYNVIINNLALIYKSTNRLDAAEEYFLESIQNNENKYGKYNILCGKQKFNLASVYRALGNFVAAEKLLREVNFIFKSSFGEENVHYANNLSLLGSLYSDLQKFDEAEKYLLEALKINKKILGEHHDYIESLHNLAGHYLLRNKNEKAKALIFEEEKLVKKIFGEEHIKYASCLTSLGLYYSRYDVAKAELYYNKALSLFKKIYGENSYNLTGLLANLALLNWEKGKINIAEKFLLEMNSLVNNFVLNNFSFLNEKEKEYLLNDNVSYYETVYSFALVNKKNGTKLNKQIFNNLLMNKSLILNSNINLFKFAAKSQDTLVTKNLKKWIEIKKNLAKLYISKDSLMLKKTFALEKEADDIEKKLGRLIPEIKNFVQNNRIEWTDVQKSLKPNETAIEFISFTNHTPLGWKDSIYYCAMVLRQNMKQPEMVYLFEERQIISLLNRTTENDYDYLKPIYQISKGKKTLSDTLYSLVWKPIEEYLNKSNNELHLPQTQTIYYSPSGMLHKIAFDAVLIQDSILLNEKYNMVRMFSTRSVNNKKLFKFDKSLSGQIAMFGGINYEVPVDTLKKFASFYVNKDKKNAVRKFDKKTRGVEWNYLPGSFDEVKKISNLFEQNDIKTNLYTGNHATEEALKNLIKTSAPGILHIATHGFYFPDDSVTREKAFYMDLEKSQFMVSKNPLIRSGLLLSGGNRSWKEEKETEGIEDGVFTAYEVSLSNMINTELVILSACQTGLGDVKGSEGVYGLQRGFKTAGVKNMIVSLWTVPDKQTQEIMTYFYSNLIKGMDIRSAFRTAQKQIIADYNGKNVWMPYSWAAFVLVE